MGGSHSTAQVNVYLSFPSGIIDTHYHSLEIVIDMPVGEYKYLDVQAVRNCSMSRKIQGVNKIVRFLIFKNYFLFGKI